MSLLYSITNNENKQTLKKLHKVLWNIGISKITKVRFSWNSPLVQFKYKYVCKLCQHQEKEMFTEYMFAILQLEKEELNGVGSVDNRPSYD